MHYLASNTSIQWLRLTLLANLELFPPAKVVSTCLMPSKVSTQPKAFFISLLLLTPLTRMVWPTVRIVCSWKWHVVFTLVLIFRLTFGEKLSVLRPTYLIASLPKLSPNLLPLRPYSIRNLIKITFASLVVLLLSLFPRSFDQNLVLL